MKFFPKINKISRVERTTDSISKNFGSWFIFRKMFWKIFIFAYAVDLISKAIIHRFYNYVICYDGEYCDRQSVFIRWVIDGQLYLSHVKHGYRDMTERIMSTDWEAKLLNWATNHVERLIDYNIPDLYFFYLSPLIVVMFWGLFVSIGKNKDSTNLLAIGVALYCAGALGNRTELFFFGWATDFIGIPKDSLIERIPRFIQPIGPGIANLADFFLVIGRILFIIGLFNVKDYKRKAIPLPQTSEIPKDKSLVIKSDKKS
jgi:lipoprotein signal peptidase